MPKVIAHMRLRIFATRNNSIAPERAVLRKTTAIDFH